MPTVTFYGDVAKTNSTHIPTTVVTSGDCLLKHPTDLYNPTIVFNGECNAATQFSLMGKYYWVTKMVSVRNGVWEVTGRENVLATYKNPIGNATGFITYADTADNKTIVDDRLTTKAQSIILEHEEYLCGFLNLYNPYVSVGITVIDSTGVYLMTQTELRDLLSPYSGKTTTQIQKALGAGEVTCINSVSGAFWLPISYNQQGWLVVDPYNIMFGTDIDSGVPSRRTGVICTSSPECELVLTTQVSDWRSLNSYVELRLPLYGTLTIPGKSFLTLSNDIPYFDGHIFFKYYFNLYSGDYTIEIYRKVDGGKKLVLATVGGNCAVSIPVGACADLSGVKMIDAMSNMVGNAFSGNWGGALGSAAEGLGVLTHTVNTSQPMTISSGGGGCAYLNTTVIANLIFTPVAIDMPNEATYKALNGVPVQRDGVIATVTASGTGGGYVQGRGLKITAHITDNERQEIETLFNKGFYYEA